jgi:hypothetical protein
VSADERIPLLLKTPAALRFVSVEPLFGPVDISRYLTASKKFHLSADVAGMLVNRSFDALSGDGGRPLTRREAEAELRALLARGVKLISSSDECSGFSEQTGCPGHPEPKLDWVIVGGESGPQARPCDVAWVRSIVEQCKAAEVPCFVKQLGAVVVDLNFPTSARNLPGDRPGGWTCRGHWVTNDGREPHGPLLCSRKGGDPAEWPEDLRVREWPA